MKRTFISIPVPSRVLGIKQMLVSTFSDPADVKWVKNINIHLTLKFLGDTQDDSITKINQVLSKIADRTPTMELMIEKTGCFPNEEKPTVLWMGVNGPTDNLLSLVNNINDKLVSFGYDIDPQPFIPHITIGRIKYSNKKPPNAQLFLQSSYDGIALQANQMQFISSQLTKEGPIYTILGTHNFGI